MPRPYSDDLRSKFLQAYAAGAGDLSRLAQRFCVSYGWAKKIRRQELSSGQTARAPQRRHGFPSRVGTAQRAWLRAWLDEQPDATDEELRRRLAASGVSVCKSRIGQLLREMGARRKKNRSTPRSATRKPTSNGAKRSLPGSASLIRNA